MVRSPEPLSARSARPLFAPQLPLVDLSPAAARPLYEQLYLALRDQIVRGRLRQGGRLASTRRLAEHLALSRRGTQLSSAHVTGPRPEEPRAFQARRGPLDVFPLRAWSAIVRRLWRR